MTHIKDHQRVRLYQRGQRWYGDFRHLGGGREALIPEGESRATTHRLVATDLYVQRAKELLDVGVAKNLGISRRVTVRGLGDAWWDALRESSAAHGSPRPGTLRTIGGRLAGIVRELGPETLAARVDGSDVERFIRVRRKAGLELSTALAEVSLISQLFRWAIRKRYVVRNPVREAELPEDASPERPFLEPAEVGYLIAAASQDNSPAALPYIAGLALTGMRSGELVGLDAADVEWEANLIHVRPNRWRLLKTKAATRDVPIWPQLRPLLPHVIAGPLFPGRGTRRGRPRQDRADLFRRVVARARAMAAKDGVAFPAKTVRVTPHTLRHTYAAMRLQTVENGEPVAPWTVLKECGWRGLKMLEAVYAHIPKDRRRLAVVEYPVPATGAIAERSA